MDEAFSSWPLILAIFAPLVAGVVTMWIPRAAITPRTLIAAVGPLLSFALVAWFVATHGIVDPHHPEATAVIPWIDFIHLNLAFFPDGLAVFFALLVSGIGFLIVLYARGYFGPDGDALFRFYPTLGFFTTAMMGIVLSDYMLLTLLFWELTSISSFLLIGWDREDKRAVKLAMQAFFTTGLGGMGLFGGILLLGLETDAWRWSTLLAAPIEVTGGVIGAFLLMFLGAATKSAQWPFHYWLPGAMAAPTPVSAYLHSATMVKAGVYLTARLFPILGGLDIWPWVILVPGAITMLLGAVLALNQHDLKRIFAYTTVSQLGLLMCAYALGGLEIALHGGYGDSHGEHGAGLLPLIDWDLSQIANHAFYKAPLFIIAGAIGHYAGTRDLPKLFGFWRQNKIMVIVTVLAAYALAGGPGTISFPAKELFFYAIYHAFEVSPWFQALAAMAVITAACNVAIFVRLTSTLLGWRVGLKSAPDDHGEHDHHEHEHGFWGSMIWVPAAIIVSLQYIGGLYPPAWNAVFAPIETNINYETFAHGLPFVWEVHWGVPVAMSLIAFVAGILLGVSPFFRGSVVDPHDLVYPGLYWLAVTGGGRAFRVIQTGHFRAYLTMAMGALVIGFIGAVSLDPDMLRIETASILEFWPGAALGVIVCASALILPMTQIRVVRVLFLGACGFSVVGMYLIYQAPDLALTQLMFEIISVMLFVLVLRLLPEPDTHKSPGRIWRLAVSGTLGLMFGWMTLIGANSEAPSKLGAFFASHSYEGTELTGGRGAGGDNIVNVILVDFRGFDTLGEISVLAIAALGVWSLLPRFRATTDDPVSAESRLASEAPS